MELFTRPKKPLLNDLRKIFGKVNPRTLKAFEQLFEAVPGDFNSLAAEIQELDEGIAIADAKGRVALSLIEILSILAENSALSPSDQPAIESEDLSPSFFDPDNSYKDLSPKGEVVLASSEDLSPPPIPIEGATGTFTTVDSKTVTVENGIITEIT